jgi:hypothetical protein
MEDDMAGNSGEREGLEPATMASGSLRAQAAQAMSRENERQAGLRQGSATLTARVDAVIRSMRELAEEIGASADAIERHFGVK